MIVKVVLTSQATDPLPLLEQFVRWKNEQMTPETVAFVPAIICVSEVR